MGQKLGQHFLINPKVPEDIANALEAEAGNTIIEVGPGHGELTQAIATRIGNQPPEPTRLVAVERDPILAAATRQRFHELSYIEIVEDDILTFLEKPTTKALLSGPYKLAGNLPYYLTGYLLRKVGELERLPERALFMVQKEVAERMAAVPPRMNRLAASVQFWADVEIVRQVLREDFNPPPQVDSAIVLLKPHRAQKTKDSSDFYEAVQVLFAQPRKTIFNNLRTANEKRGASAEKVSGVLAECGVAPDARPQDLSIAQIQKLGEWLHAGKSSARK